MCSVPFDFTIDFMERRRAELGQHNWQKDYKIKGRFNGVEYKVEQLKSNDGEIETKVLDQIVDEQGMESDDERVVEHLSPQTLLETPNDAGFTQYALRANEGGTITYRVLHVDDTIENGSQIVSTGTNFGNTGVQQVLTSNLNGQLYVIGNPSEVFTNQGGTRAIAPRASLLDTTTTVQANIKKCNAGSTIKLQYPPKRDERRRATHNEVERRRRDKINNWITKLSKIIPESNTAEMKGNGHYEGQSKGGILAKACEYIHELKESNQKVEVYAKENKSLNQNVEILKQQNLALERENINLREYIQSNGLQLPKEFLS